jgi:hypothetical protein
MFAAHGSTITHAIASPSRSKARRVASRSLNGTTIVSATAPAVIPGVPGMPSVATPEPAAARSASEWPW